MIRLRIGVVASMAMTATASACGATGGEAGHPVPSLFWTVPFAVLLLAIAVLPLVPRTAHAWEHNHNKFALSLVLGLIVLAYYAFRGYGYHDAPAGSASVLAVAEHALLRDYLPFMVLLFCLYVVAGGMHLKGDLPAHPATNTAFLAVGALLASLIGTTGASMLLIRPLLQTNSQRQRVSHTVVFFIFLVSNIGGCLLPLGDPPLFLGYLQGVPFLWTLRLVVPWLTAVCALLVIYFAWDSAQYRRETKADIASDKDVRHVEPLRLRGSINLPWLLGIVLSVALIVPGRPLPGTDIVARDYIREAVMLALAGLSLATTPRGLRKNVEFNYSAIAEVACLFLGIFLTMQVPIEILRARGAELGLTRPTHYFWATGILSSFLDNAPTYLVFLETAKAMPAVGPTVTLLQGAVRQDLLAAISLGAVFMGANTYIGNGPNFMVKAIAESRGIKMPGFFGYMAYSGAILIPLFAILTLLFFS